MSLICAGGREKEGLRFVVRTLLKQVGERAECGRYVNKYQKFPMRIKCHVLVLRASLFGKILNIPFSPELKGDRGRLLMNWEMKGAQRQGTGQEGGVTKGKRELRVQEGKCACGKCKR